MQPIAIDQSSYFKKYHILLLLVPWATLYAACLDLFIPTLPYLVNVFNVPQSKMQYAQSIFVFVLGMSQFFLGPITDYFGRRTVVLYSLSLLFFANCLAAIANNYTFFLVTRVLEAIGCAGVLLSAYASVRDHFDNAYDATKAIGILNASIGICWIFLPLVGGYINNQYGWRYIFIILSALTAFSFFHSYSACENPQKDSISQAIKISSIWSLIKHPNIQFYGLASAFSQAACFTFTSQSPFILIDTLGMGYKEFGLYFGSITLSYTITNLLSAKIIQHFKTFYSVQLASACVVLGALLLFGTTKIIGGTTVTFLMSMLLIIGGSGFLSSMALWGVMAPFKENAGSAISIIGCFRFIFAACVASFSMIYGSSALFMSIVIGGLGLFVIAFGTFIKPKLFD